MKLLLIDGYSLLYRAFFSSPPFSTKAGEPTGALFGFSKMALSLLDEMQPTHVLVALDAHGPTFRHDADATYKAGRADMPDELRSQTKAIREMLPGLSIPFYEHAGFEADDIIGTLSRMACDADEEMEVVIVTGDGDALQLVDEHVCTMLTRRGVSDLEAYTPQTVQKRYQFAPPLMRDYKGLRGDSSDNIPGVPGIGDKTAIALISEHGDLDAIYANLENVKPPRIQKLLTEHRETAFHSRQMATIVRDLPIEIDLEFCRYNFDDEAKKRALETMRRYEFRSLAARYSDDASQVPSTPTSTAARRDMAAPETQARNFSMANVENGEKLSQWLQSSGEPVATLWEENEDAARLILARGDEVKIYHGDVAQLSWLESDAPKIAHDAKNLKLQMAARSVSVKGIVADTFLMGYLLEPSKAQQPIDKLALKYLGRTLPVEMEVPKKKANKSKDKSLFEDEEEEAAERELADNLREQHLQVLAANAIAVWDLQPILKQEMSETAAWKLLEEIELPLIDVLVGMEQCGMQLDRAQLEKLDAQLTQDIERLQREIWNLAGKEFNVGSTKQLQVVLYEDLKLSAGRKIKTGYSTDVHTLERLAEDNEIVRKILDYRGLTKLKSTYVDALLSAMDDAQRIHTNLNQTGTVSGRLSSSNPNLQNVPIRTAQGRQIRRAFIAPPGHVLLAADYSQIELRILAHITGDATLVEAFQTGQDVHARTAADLFGIALENVDKEMRRKAKMTNYAIAYGVSGFGLAKQLGSGTAGEAQEFIKQYFVALPGVKKYIDDTMQQARVDGWVQTLLGRRRPVPEIVSPRAVERAAAERTAINHPIQGTSADAMKLAMLAIADELRAKKLKTRITMQVHDELVFEVPDDEIEAVSELVGRLMREVPTRALELRVPLEVDVEIGPNWDETDPVSGDVEDEIDFEELTG